MPHMATKALSLRMTLLVALLTLLLATLPVALVSTYRQWRHTVDELSNQVLVRTSQVIERRVARLLSTAQSGSTLAQTFVARREAQGLDRGDFEAITDDFHALMVALPEISFVNLGLQDSGAYCHVQRRPDSTLRIQLCEPPVAGFTRRREWEWGAVGRTLVLDTPHWHYDPRVRPYYRAAVAAGKPVWTDTYTFVDPQGGDMVGVTLAAPRYDSKKALRCVVSVDFTLQDITRFLRGVRLGETGFGFLVEERGTTAARRVIASGDSGKTNADPVLRAALRRIERKQVAAGLQTARIQVQGIRYLLSWRRIAETDAPHWIVCTLTPEDELLGRIEINQRNTLLQLTGLSALAVLACIGLAHRIATPLRLMALEAESIRRLDLAPDPAPRARFRIQEVDQLYEALERTKTGLRSFAHFVPIEYVRHLVESGQEAGLGGERREVSVLFADLAGFTRIAEQKAPEEAVALLTPFLERVSRAVAASGGIVDKYNGDEVMAFWQGDDHAIRACQAALAVQASGENTLPMRMGISTGEAIVGVIGSQERYNYTVLGDTVNLGKRLEGLNKAYRTPVLLSEATVCQVKDLFLTRPVDVVAVVGKQTAVEVHALLGLRTEAPEALHALAAQTEAALRAYQNRDFAKAQALCAALLADYPDDGPATVLAERAATFQQAPPPADWDGVWRITEK